MSVSAKIYFLIAISSLCNASDFQSPRTAALGGSGHAAPLLNDSIYQNPTQASFLKKYSVSAAYGSFQGETKEDDPGLNGKNYNVSVLDARNENFQAGVGYAIRSGERYIHVSMSKAISDKLALGAGTKFIMPKEVFEFDNSDFSFSIGFVPSQNIQFALIVDNLIQREDNSKKFNLYREITLGLKIELISKVKLYADPHLTPLFFGNKRFGYEVGAEVSVFEDLYLRGGYFHQSLVPTQGDYGDGYGLGAGWMAPKISFDYAYSMAVKPKPASTHTFGLTVFF